VERGDFVSAWLPNGKDALRAWLGANAAGAVYAPLNPAYRGSILEHTVNLSGAKLMITHPDLVARLRGLELPRLEKIVVLGETDVELPGIELLPRDVLHRPATARPRLDPPLEAWDIVALISTSGTTGPSKAVLCPYLHHHTYAEQLLPWHGPDDRFFVYLPMFHAGGTTAIYGMLERGGSVAITDGFRTQTFLEDARRFGATHATILGSMATFLLKQEPRADDADNPLRTAFVTPMVDDPQAFCDRFGIDVLTGYGLTEGTCPIRTDRNPADPLSCGRRSSPDYELRLVDEHDREVPTGEPGELIIRHSRPWSLNAGYKDMPEETARAWRNGWFHTGDAMRMDGDGNYFFVDRAKDALRRRGENISSMEVEREILAHPDVLEAAVVAAPADGMEDEVRVFVALRPGASLDPRELTEWLVPRLPHFMVPRYVDLIDELPKTESQKVQKYKLKELPLTGTTWDREAAGIRLRRDKLTTKD
jgi:crotonobetaine/carnitine-CoA ligase